MNNHEGEATPYLFNTGLFFLTQIKNVQLKKHVEHYKVGDNLVFFSSESRNLKIKRSRS